MRILTTLLLFIGVFAFSQNEHQRIQDLCLSNQYKKAISEIENLNLQKKADFRFLYWDAKSKTDPKVNSRKLVHEIFGADTLNSEYILTKFKIIHTEFNLSDDQAIEIGQYLEKYIDGLDKTDKYKADLNMLFAEYLFELDYYKECIKRCKMALKLDKEIRNGHLIMGYSNIILGKASGAKSILKELSINKANPDVFYVLGELDYYLKGEYTDEAIESFEMAVTISPEEYEYLVYLLDAHGERGEYGKVISIGKEKLKKFNINELKYYIADAYFMMDLFDKSIEICTTADKNEDSYEYVLAVEEQNYVYLEDYEKALKATLKLQGMAPEEELYKYFEAEIYYYQEEDDLALQILEKQIKNGAKSSMFSLMAGELYYANDDEDKAFEMYSLAMEKEDIWENMYEDQLIEILDLTYDSYDTETYLENLETIKQNFDSENIECIIKYFKTAKSNPDSYEKELDEKCINFIEVGDVE